MKDLIFIDIVVEHMQKMHKQITCESKQIDIMSKIGNQFVLKAKTVNEIMVLSDLLKLLTGMTRTELTKEIRMREIQEMKEIDLDELPESQNGKKLVRFKEWVCELQFGKYHGNDRIAIELVDHKTYEPIAFATVNVPEIPLKENEIIIKDYSENQGMFQALFNAGIVKLNRIDTQSEWVDFYICELLIEPKFE